MVLLADGYLPGEHVKVLLAGHVIGEGVINADGGVMLDCEIKGLAIRSSDARIAPRITLIPPARLVGEITVELRTSA